MSGWKTDSRRFINLLLSPCTLELFEIRQWRVVPEPSRAPFTCRFCRRGLLLLLLLHNFGDDSIVVVVVGAARQIHHRFRCTVGHHSLSL